MNKNGKFIVLEGLEGAGKSTALLAIIKTLEFKGISSDNIIITREPGGTPFSENLRALLKDKKTVIHEHTEALLMIASRVELVHQKILPALQQGKYVISDRFSLSTLAYQGGGRGISLDLLRSLHSLCLDNLTPDLTLYLDIPPSLGFERIQQRGHLDRIEQEDLSFFERVRAIYQECIAKQWIPSVLIDATQPMPFVHEAINKELHKIFS